MLGLIVLAGLFCATMLFVKLVASGIESTTQKKCPACREFIAHGATICKHCRQTL
jgi:hypothetical protein